MVSIVQMHSGTHDEKQNILVSMRMDIVNVRVQTAKGCTKVVIQYGNLFRVIMVKWVYIKLGVI